MIQRRRTIGCLLGCFITAVAVVCIAIWLLFTSSYRTEVHRVRLGEALALNKVQVFTLVEIVDTGVTIRGTKTGTHPPEPRFDWALTFRDIDPTNRMVAAEAVYGSHYDGYRTNVHWLGAGQSVTTQAGGVYTIQTVNSDHAEFTRYTDYTINLGATLGMGNLSYLQVSEIDHPGQEVTFVYSIPKRVALLLDLFMM